MLYTMPLSIIIPTYHEEAYLGKTLEAIYQRVSTPLPEVIVVDCGSIDRTVTIARQYPVVVIEDPSLKGSKWKSLNLGAAVAQGNVFLFLDADSIVPPRFDQAIRQCLQQREVVGGAFEFAFDEDGIAYQLITQINRIRYRLSRRFYGDQGIFVRRVAFDQAGGWPALDIMEAAYFCKELQTLGQLQLIPLPLKASTRRFAEGGITKVFLYDIGVWWMDLLGWNVQRFARAYWWQNERRGKDTIVNDT